MLIYANGSGKVEQWFTIPHFAKMSHVNGQRRRHPNGWKVASSSLWQEDKNNPKGNIDSLRGKNKFPGHRKEAVF